MELKLLVLVFYLIGVVLAFLLQLKFCKKYCFKIKRSDYRVILLVSAFSWLAVFTLLEMMMNREI